MRTGPEYGGRVQLRYNADNLTHNASDDVARSS